MTLPTEQPLDWPDWGLAPTYQLREYIDPSETVSPLVVAEVRMGYSSYATVFLPGDGGGEPQEWSIGWFTDTASEGGSLVASHDIIRPFGYSIIVPMSAYAPVLRLTLTFDPDPTFGYIAYITQMAQRPLVVGYPGGVTVRNNTETVTASTDYAFIPNGCAPGEHEYRMSTTGTSWSLILRQWWNYNGTNDIVLATGAAAGTSTGRFIAPASAWDLFYRNLNAGNDDVTMLINRVP